MSQIRLLWLENGEQRGVPALEVVGLSVKVGIRTVLTDISFRLYRGDRLQVTGPNGSGKSSLLNAVAGLPPARLTGGKIFLDGRDVTGESPHERARRGLRYVRQRSNVFPDLTVAENLRLAVGRREALAAAADGLERARVPCGKRASLLSGGQRQLLAWAMMTSGFDPACELLLADEPEAGVERPLPLPPGATCLLVSHRFEQEDEI